MKNLDLVKKKEADRYFFRNRNSISNLTDKKILDLIKINSIKANNILEIGCANGNKLNQYSNPNLPWYFCYLNPTYNLHEQRESDPI